MARHNTGPKLALNPAGYYEIRWTEDGRSKRLSTGASEILEAQTFLAGFLHEQGRDAKRPPTVRVLIAAYLAERIKDKSPRTVGVARNALIPFFGDITVDALTADKIAAFELERGKKACSGTIRREVGVLVAAVNHAKRQRRIDPSLIPYIALPEGSPARKETFTMAQLDQLIQLVAPGAFERCSRICRFVWLAMETASRRHAIETLSWAKQVNFKTRVIDYESDGSGTIRKIKRRAQVPVSARLLPMLERFHKEKETDFVLDHPGDMYQGWKALMKKAAKLTGDKSFIGKVPHDMRRTWATQAAQSGISMFDIAGVLADSPATAAKHYAHHSTEFLRAAVDFRAAK